MVTGVPLLSNVTVMVVVDVADEEWQPLPPQPTVPVAPVRSSEPTVAGPLL